MISVNDALYSNIATRSTTKSNGITEDQLGSAFMSLLLAQMKNQNPLEPMDDSQMISQMAQLNSLDELKKISKSLSSMTESNAFVSSLNLIGKNVTYKNADGEEKTSKVSGVSMKGSDVYLKIGSQYIKLTNEISVTADETVSDPA
jgi:flagellar basal-body rod modification protein FlgD